MAVTTLEMLVWSGLHLEAIDNTNVPITLAAVTAIHP